MKNKNLLFALLIPLAGISSSGCYTRFALEEDQRSNDEQYATTQDDTTNMKPKVFIDNDIDYYPPYTWTQPLWYDFYWYPGYWYYGWRPYWYYPTAPYYAGWYGPYYDPYYYNDYYYYNSPYYHGYYADVSISHPTRNSGFRHTPARDGSGGGRGDGRQTPPVVPTGVRTNTATVVTDGPTTNLPRAGRGGATTTQTTVPERPKRGNPLDQAPTRFPKAQIADIQVPVQKPRPTIYQRSRIAEQANKQSPGNNNRKTNQDGGSSSVQPAQSSGSSSSGSRSSAPSYTPAPSSSGSRDSGGSRSGGSSGSSDTRSSGTQRGGRR
jgi:hypothetical protein